MTPVLSPQARFMNRSITCVLAVAWFVSVSVAQSPPPARLAEPTETMADRFPDLEARLHALTPDSPEDYFLLGEEVAALARLDIEFELAESLFVLAFVLDGVPIGPSERKRASVRAPVCLALASTTTSTRRARWLLAIAGVVDPRYSRPDWSGAVDPAPSPRDRAMAAEAISTVRSGDGARARSLLARPNVRRLYDRFSALITGAGPSAVIGGLEAEAAKWPCPECRNARISVKRHSGNIQRTLCNTCLGDPGWATTRAEMIATLRFESAMLRGTQRSWGAQAAIDLGAPLRDPDPSELAPTYRVDPRAVYWRGAWVRTPATTPPEPDGTDEETNDAERTEP